MKRFADSAYSICFLSLFEFGLVHPKIKFSSTCFGEYKRENNNNKKTVLIVILFFLVHSCDDLSLSVQLRDKTQITHGLSSRNTGFSPWINDGRFQ